MQLNLRSIEHAWVEYHVAESQYMCGAHERLPARRSMHAHIQWYHNYKGQELWLKALNSTLAAWLKNSSPSSFSQSENKLQSSPNPTNKELSSIPYSHSLKTNSNLPQISRLRNSPLSPPHSLQTNSNLSPNPKNKELASIRPQSANKLQFSPNLPTRELASIRPQSENKLQSSPNLPTKELASIPPQSAN
jgi:hypothetical protein